MCPDTQHKPVELKQMHAMSAKGAGFSLVELMVAVALSSFLLLGVVELYVSNKQTNTLQNGFSQVQENGRMAVEMVSRDIRRADFWGCIQNASSDYVENNLNTGSSNYDASLHDFSAGGIDESNDVSGVKVGATAVVNGTDILVLKGSRGDDIRIGKPYMPTSAAAIHLLPGHGVKQNDVVLVADCTKGDIFQVTNTNPGTSNTAVHNTGTGTIGNTDKNFQKSYGADARILRPYTTSYFIANDVNGRPSLFVSNDGAVAELIPGVEDMQVLYGEDTNEDLVVDAWRDANAVGFMERVIAVRVEFTVRSYDQVGANQPGETDRRLRRTYTVTSNVRNRMI